MRINQNNKVFHPDSTKAGAGVCHTGKHVSGNSWVILRKVFAVPPSYLSAVCYQLP